MVSLLNPAQVSARLREHEESFLIERGNGVVRYDIAQLPSNNPIEDDHSERIVQVPLVTPDDQQYSTDWLFWGVYDGHGGWSTSTKLRESLIGYVTRELDKIYTPVAPNSPRRLVPSPEAIDKAVETAFVSLDDEIVNKTRRRRSHPPALSGSCALLAFYDTASRDLRVAVAGDSRAVLGTKEPDGSWKARALTTDQTGSNEEEARRIKKEHPGEEETAVRRGRVLGIYEPTRAFGDATTKWSREIQHSLARQFFGRTIPRDLRTPPYMTARPEITRTRLEKDQLAFLVLATDGLYEMLSNEQVVSMVVEWINQKRPASLRTMLSQTEPSGSKWIPKWVGGGKNKRSEQKVEDVSANKDAQKQPIRRQSSVPVQISVQDQNAATHLMRNALGGADQESVSMLVSIPSPLSRRYRDDLTVTVVFFGDNVEDTGKIRVNNEATYVPSKAKL
ncbi:[Pyruvate dehydrogenase [acetyl-transferring]]-phosphatase 1, mitochondrial [Wickerhamiella sorbophila]|uniref:[Pyruvate dehydrogenase [acetyl-transferring]]-phosphatase 1, mitochondrial n=1 Tax=Wickerhamiella sorbophila TaxID=45607 RepID=A0A2T0FGG6_9ASCO|nr:[Pyruvate dehydrogenase [acetyl-transferring]]-phosphatase 1, mitochondrial [Wickerhamiella sorbophila]PRT54093.1 [Pyruvate dehydrogenase [acetyl-transferring]]-phosphatase 1, mitochondrial [Wickerhamiella sorbophila]